MVLITREIEPVIIVGGHLINELINKIIKVSIKSPRPDFHKNFGRDGGSYGMTYGFLQLILNSWDFSLGIIFVLYY